MQRATASELSSIKDKPLWIDVTNITHAEAKELETIFGLHPLTTEDIVQDHVRVKIEVFSEYMFCVFYAITSQKDEIGLHEFDFVLGKNFLITNHRKPLPSCAGLLANPEKLESLFRKGVDFIFYTLLDAEVDDYFPALETIDKEIDKLEEQVTLHPTPKHMRAIIRRKRALTPIRRVAFNQREKISFLAKQEYPFISKKALPYFRDVYDHYIHVSDLLDNYRESLSNVFEVYMSAVSNNTNEIMKVLSVIATIALPLTVISSIYGTNFKILPGADVPAGFWIMLLGMLLISQAMLLYFRKRHWF